MAIEQLKSYFMGKPTPNPGLSDLPAYVGGKSVIFGVQQVVKLSSNENPLGPSPKVRAFLNQDWKNLARYPDGGCTQLREDIARVHDIPCAQIVCGAGSDELITLLCKGYCRAGDEVISSQHGFLMYKLSALSMGATPVTAPEKNLTTDVEAILACVTDKTKIVFIANPNNPTGTWIDKAALERLIDGLPQHVILALDGAYSEYVDDPDYTDGRDLVRDNENVIMLRTFSKIYGIAALRLGWMYAPAAICDVMNRLRGPFNVSMLTQQVGAIAVRDQDYVRACCAENAKLREYLTGALQILGFEVIPSQANFILVRFAGAPCSADAADNALKANGMIVRRMESYGLDNALRITIGRKEDVTHITQVFEELCA